MKPSTVRKLGLALIIVSLCASVAMQMGTHKLLIITRSGTLDESAKYGMSITHFELDIRWVIPLLVLFIIGIVLASRKRHESTI
jgi:hypothetical protein